MDVDVDRARAARVSEIGVSFLGDSQLEHRTV